MNVDVRFERLRTVQITVRDLQSPIARRIPRDASTRRIEARAIKIVSVFIRFPPGKEAAFHFKASPNGSERRHPKGNVTGILPVMRNGRVGVIHRAQPMHEGRWAKRRLTWITQVKICREVAAKLLRKRHRQLVEKVMRMLTIVQ